MKNTYLRLESLVSFHARISNGYCVVGKTGINVVFKDFFEAKSI